MEGEQMTGNCGQPTELLVKFGSKPEFLCASCGKIRRIFLFDELEEWLTEIFQNICVFSGKLGAGRQTEAPQCNLKP